MKTFTTLAVAIVAEVTATTALKSSAGLTRPGPSIVVVLGYVLAFYFMSLALKTLPVGLVYAVWSGAGIVLLAGLGWLFFGQKLDLFTLAGMALILAGILVVSLAPRASIAHEHGPEIASTP